MNVTCPFPLPHEFPATLLTPTMPDDDDRIEGTEQLSIPEPPPGTAMETAKRAWQVAWGASNAAAGYHASVLRHIVEHEKRMLSKVSDLRGEVETRIQGEIEGLKRDVTRDFNRFRTALVSALGSVGIHINLTPSGEHAIARLTQGATIVEEPVIRDRVASSHDLEEGFAEVGEQIDERFAALSRELQPGARSLQPIPSERVREMLAQERERVEADQKILRLELERSQLELAHAQELKRVGDQKAELAEANSRWLRVGFMIAGGIITVLVSLLIWVVTKHPPSIG